MFDHCGMCPWTFLTHTTKLRVYHLGQIRTDPLRPSLTPSRAPLDRLAQLRVIEFAITELHVKLLKFKL